MWTREEHVRGFCRSFLLPEKKARLEQLLLSKRRQHGVDELDDSKWIDSRFARRVATWEVGDECFRTRGLVAGSLVYVISGDNRLDDREMELAEAIEAVMGVGWGTVVSCVPGRLCLFEGEYIDEERLVLMRA